MSSLSFTLIQSNLFWENATQNLEMFSKKLDAIDRKTNVVILPEMFSTGFSMQPNLFAEKMDGITINWMKHQATKHKIILCGSVMIEAEGNYFNRFVWMQPNGVFATYDKKHLFAFAGENNYFTAGKNQIITQANGLKIKPLICYDLRFPVWARQQTNTTNDMYDVLLYVANWPERRSYAWKSLLVARAIENQCFVIAVNRIGKDGNDINHSGDSMIINPLGEIIYSKADEEAIFTYTIEKSVVDEIRAKFPFYKDSDSFNIPL
jgi:omega-amidase